MAIPGASLKVVIMAAGKGTRMKSALPKVLLRLSGTSLLQHVAHTAAQLGADRVVVVTGHRADLVEAEATALGIAGLQCVRQEPQLGTGHAVQQALPALAPLNDGGTVLILNGDVPLIAAQTAQALIDASAGTRLALLTVDLPDPAGYGRIVRRDDGSIAGIVEDKDATAEQRAVREVYTGVMAAPAPALERWLAKLSNDNSQREYYLTDLVALAVADGTAVVSVQPADEAEVLGVNSAAQLADLERRLQRRRAESLMEAGVRLADPARIDIRGELHCANDVEIDVNCVFEGRVELGAGVQVGANCVLRDATIGEGAVLLPFTHIEGATVGGGARIGPFSRLRPGAELAADVHIGNFVEVKNTRMGRGAKANHLAYLGDASVGERVNVGAGSITANYDGANKHHTVIEDDAHIGSNCVLIAPLTVGAGATVGGGSVLSKDAPAGQLTVARARQVTLANWQRPRKKP